MTCQDAVLIQKLCDEVGHSKGHDDAKFCWFHLRHSKAIDFVEDRRIFGPSMLTSRGHSNRDDDSTTLEDPLEVARKDTIGFLKDKLDPVVRDIDQLSEQYKEIRQILKLDEAYDATVELESRGPLTDFLDQAKSLLRDYKASQMK